MTEAMTIHSPDPATSKPPVTPHHADALSFMGRRSRAVGGGINHWFVEGTGSYSGDCEKGAELAREYLVYIGQHPTVGNATLLGCIVSDMADHPAKGLKIGFLRVVNEYAMATAQLVNVLDIGV